jgi:purine nucleoside phosphorylase
MVRADTQDWLRRRKWAAQRATGRRVGTPVAIARRAVAAAQTACYEATGRYLARCLPIVRPVVSFPLGVITGSGTYSLPDLEDAAPRGMDTPFGAVTMTAGHFAGREVLHVSRHGAGHLRLSNHVEFRADAFALREAGARAVIGCTACGAVDPDLPPGSLVVFDDLHFASNRLPDGSLCTFHRRAGDPARGHWIFDGPFAPALRAALLEGAARAGVLARDGGVYGHVDGPRFNTRAEIAALRACGVAAVSQTGGPETVLFGELELPYALIGYVTDYANGVRPEEPTPLVELQRLMAQSTGIFAAVLAEAMPLLDDPPPAVGVNYRFESQE